MEFRIDGDVLEKFAGLTIGVVIARGIDNHERNDLAVALLREQGERVRGEWSHEHLESDSRIAAWREAYRAFGAKPKKHRSSIENMIRMIFDGAGVPSINAAVDIYNAISLKYVIPAGGDDLDRVNGDIRLTFATGEERFVPLNGAETVSPKPGEVIYRDDEDVLCRRWNWREGDKSKMTETSANLCLVVEGLPPFTTDDIGQIADELAETIERCCGGRTALMLADRERPSVEIG